MATGFLLLFLGVLLLIRTVTKDDEDRNLVDRVLGLGAGATTIDAVQSAREAGLRPLRITELNEIIGQAQGKGTANAGQKRPAFPNGNP